MILDRKSDLEIERKLSRKQMPFKPCLNAFSESKRVLQEFDRIITGSRHADSSLCALVRMALRLVALVALVAMVALVDGSDLAPVVILPGTGGSILEAKLNKPVSPHSSSAQSYTYIRGDHR